MFFHQNPGAPFVEHSRNAGTIQTSLQEDDREEADVIYEPIDEDGYVKTNFPHADKAAVANEAMYLHVIM